MQKFNAKIQQNPKSCNHFIQHLQKADSGAIYYLHQYFGVKMFGNQLIKRVVLCAMLATLAACAHNPHLEELRHASPKGTAFQNELAKLYLTYAEVAQDYGDFDSASTFAQKGLDAAYGNDVMPESPREWAKDLNLKRKQRRPFMRQYRELTELLSDEIKNEAPVAAAGSVFFYDCMLDQYAKNSDAEELTYCRQEFKNSMGDMREARSRIIAMASLSDATPDPAAPIERYLVYFALDDYTLNDAAERTVKLLFNALQAQTNSQTNSQMAPLTIVVNGHTDTSGQDRYNTILSNQRADTVKEMLISLGMKPQQIEAFGFGETDLAVPTQDNIFEPKNRRVEIVVN